MEKVTLFESESEAKSIIARGKIKVIKIGNQQFCLIHQYSGGWVVTQQYCPHMDYPLAEGHINPSNEIVCPWHGYRFSLNDGHACSGRQGKLNIYPVTVSFDGKMEMIL